MNAGHVVAQGGRFSAALCRGLIEARRTRHDPPGRRWFSAALCRGLIEALCGVYPFHSSREFSAALCRGLIEAGCPGMTSSVRMMRFPRLYAAASLKLPLGRIESRRQQRFPRLYAAASLKPNEVTHQRERVAGFSAALCRGLIEARRGSRRARDCGARFPRLYAAASLKHLRLHDRRQMRGGFPRLYAAASLKQTMPRCEYTRSSGFPRLYAAASLKQAGFLLLDCVPDAVFRGSMPRPH